MGLAFALELLVDITVMGLMSFNIHLRVVRFWLQCGEARPDVLQPGGRASKAQPRAQSFWETAQTCVIL